ncbi:MAG: hypothetical protein M3P08_16100 [Thermoproteota archaeon]|nr:hypothetical protein [Thermoproteota archaeon]
MTVQESHILNPFTLLNPSNTSIIGPHHVAYGVVNALPNLVLLFSLVVTIASIFLCSVIAMYFYRSYRFSGFGYLLGLPTGFIIIGASFVFEYPNLVYYYSVNNEFLYTLSFWVQLTLQSEGLALIALSYMLKDRTSVTNGLEISKPLLFLSQVISPLVELKNVFISIVALVVISVPVMVTISALFVQPILNDTELKDLSLYTRIFDIIILGYIFMKSIVSLVKSANIKLLYVLAVFALLWLEQYSLIIIYFDDNSAAFIGSIIVRLFGLALFVYAIRYAISSRRSRAMEVER